MILLLFYGRVARRPFFHRTVLFNVIVAINIFVHPSLPWDITTITVSTCSAYTPYLTKMKI